MTYTRWACVGSRGGADADARPQRSLRTMRPYLAAVITAAGTPSLRLPWLAAIRRWGYAVYGCFSSRSYGCADSQSTAALARDHPAAPTRILKPHWLASTAAGFVIQAGTGMRAYRTRSTTRRASASPPLVVPPLRAVAAASVARQLHFYRPMRGVRRQEARGAMSSRIAASNRD